jgi:hypothetical protein
MIKGIIQKLLVTVDDRIQFLRDGEDHMEVWRIQYIFTTGVHPLFLRELLAHGAASVTAGIIMDRDTAALFTDADVYTKSPGFTVHDVISRLPLSCRQDMLFFIGRVKTVKDILNSTFAAHASPPSGMSNGLRMPRSVLLLT